MRNLFTMAGIGMLSMLMGVPALVWAQDEPKPQRQEEPKTEPKAEPRQDTRPQPDARQQEERPPKQEEAKPPKHEDKKPEQAQQPERMQQPEHPQPERPQQQNAERPANGRGGHIPDDRFRAHFGREHTVVIRQPVVVEGQPRFQYGGYWFAIADPWPPDWAYTDQCYIDYVDGEYFLFDLLHPGVRIALFVVM